MHIYSKIYEAIDTAVQNALIINDDNNSSINYNHSSIKNNFNLMNEYVKDLKQSIFSDDIKKIYKQIKDIYYEYKIQYKVTDTNELYTVYTKLSYTKGITDNNLDLNWIDSSDVLTFILENNNEMSLSEYLSNNIIPKYIKFNNVKSILFNNDIHDFYTCNHPIIIDYLLNKKQCKWIITKDDKTKFYSGTNDIYFDFDGYLHTYENDYVNRSNELTYPAIKYCVDFSTDNYLGYLPAAGEMYFLFQLSNFIEYLLKKRNIGQDYAKNMVKLDYWTSTENDESSAYLLSSKSMAIYYKTSKFYVFPLYMPKKF